MLDVAPIALKTSAGARALISPFGGQLLSWTPAGAVEQIYTSPLPAPPGGAKRGGVPVIFPQFAEQGPGPRHGIARNRVWQLVQQEQGQRDAMAVLRLAHDAETKRLWPHEFAIELTVRIEGRQLDMELSVENLGEDSFEFQAALHSYWRIDAGSRAVVDGLQDRRYFDSVRQQEGVQHSRRLELLAAQATDRIVYAPAAPLQLLELGATQTRTLLLQSEGFDDVVVWNPGPQHGLQDLPADDWQRFVGLELAQIEHPPRLRAGEEWVARQSIQLL
jgi:glucose-6-phosphate 1-epimerase